MSQFDARRGPAASGRRRTALALSIGLFVVLTGIAFTLGAANGTLGIDHWLQVVAYTAFEVVGAVVMLQVPGNRIGWICIAIGIGGALGGAATEYETYAAVRGLAGVGLASIVLTAVAFPAVALAFTFLPLLFPDGHLPSPRWRVVAWLAALDIAMLAFAFGFAASSGSTFVESAVRLIPPGPLAEAIQTAAGALTIVAGVLCASALVVRYRTAAREERLQLKWVAAAVTIFAASLVVSIAASPLDLFPFAIPLLPLSVGVAVLRYRLYDIDVLINRALVYVPLSALLAGLYAASVALFQRLFTALTGDRSDAAIVITTLILAALFTPIRKAFEGAVDARFGPPKPALAPSPAARLPIGVDDPALERRVREIARAEVREALAEREAGG
jgi:hypothetical protein